MQLEQLIFRLQDASLPPLHCISIAYVSELPILWRSRFLSVLKARLSLPLVSISLDQMDINVVKATLETTFLGQVQYFWLEGFAQLDKKKLSSVMEYLCGYEGPHTLFLFGTAFATLPAHSLAIDLPPSLDKAGFIHLATFFGKTAAVKNLRFIKGIYEKHDTLSLDLACVLTDYAELVGTNTEIFCKSWLDSIVIPEKSLFTLSQYFFAKDSSAFFSCWAAVANEYPPVFWISFWSEQLWRAVWVIDLYKEGKVMQAKKIGYRLPFAFLQRDWKKITVWEITQAHDFLYGLDYHLKNGGQMEALDLLYAKFFSGDFL